MDRLGIKFFATEPVADLRSLVPVFHAWIQQQAVTEHLLIDVHDYSHIHHGPGILLVAHEGHFSMDLADGRLGLLYNRKQRLTGSPDERLAQIVRFALQPCRLLEDQNIHFRMDEFVIVANDRLNAPNDEAAFDRFQPVVSKALNNVFPGQAFNLTRLTADPKERLAIRMTVAEAN